MSEIGNGNGNVFVLVGLGEGHPKYKVAKAVDGVGKRSRCDRFRFRIDILGLVVMVVGPWGPSWPSMGEASPAGAWRK